jgi:hypothetical protein
MFLYKGAFILSKTGWLLSGGICAFCIIFYVAVMLPQDVIFSEYKKALRNIQHPMGTSFVKVYNSFGALDKTRIMYKDDFPQGCDYSVAEVREYSGTQESIRGFYSNKSITVNAQESPIGIMFIPMDSNGLINPYGLTRDEVIKWGPGVFSTLENLKNDQSSGFLILKPLATYYLISSGGFSLSDLDFRCLL